MSTSPKRLTHKPPHVFRVPIFVTLASFAMLWWGWHCCEEEGMQFSRAGALVTACALAFTFWRYSNVLSNAEQIIAQEVQKDLAKSNINPAIRASAQLKTQNYVHNIRSRTEAAITWWQGIILAVGTLVWGFGDLLFQYRTMSWVEMIWRLGHFGSKARFPWA